MSQAPQTKNCKKLKIVRRILILIATYLTQRITDAKTSAKITGANQFKFSIVREDSNFQLFYFIMIVNENNSLFKLEMSFAVNVVANNFTKPALFGNIVKPYIKIKGVL